MKKILTPHSWKKVTKSQNIVKCIHLLYSILTRSIPGSIEKTEIIQASQIELKLANLTINNYTGGICFVFCSTCILQREFEICERPLVFLFL